jgi:hypothetical protein
MMKVYLPGKLYTMNEEHIGKGTIPVAPRPVGARWLIYWCGRFLQMIGLVLIWCVLLLFTDTAAGMGVLLYWSAAAALVFYAGWACMMWATGKW